MLNKWRLIFRDNQLEKEYRKITSEKVKGQQRFLFVFSILFYWAFALIDLEAVPERVPLFWTIRFGIYTPLVIAFLIFTYTKSYDKYRERATWFISIIGTSGLLIMTMVGASYDFYSYKYGFLFALIFISNLTKLRFLNALSANIIMFVSYLLVNTLYPVIPTDVHVDAVILYGCVIMLGGFSNYLFEYSERSQFVLLRELEHTREEVEDMNAELEEKVEQRTQLLNETNAHLMQANDKLTSSEYTFRKLFEDSADAIVLLHEDVVTTCNQSMLTLLGYDHKQHLVGKVFWHLFDEEPTQNSVSFFQRWLTKKDGTSFFAELRVTEIVINGRNVNHLLIRDVTKRLELEQKLEYLSYHDQLTGLYNRRFFEEALKRIDVKRNLPLSIVFADVNGLKLINDSFGHEMGDELLKSVASILTSTCRADEIIARLGGDEFTIALQNTGLEEAEQIVNRMRLKAETTQINGIGLSVSFGIDTKLHVHEEMKDVIKRAEDAMYRVKLFEGPSMRSKMIKVIIQTLYEKNPREKAHSERVSVLSHALGKAVGVSEERLKELETMAYLHDIGKIAIEDSILNKPSALTAQEYEEVKKHPEIGYRILNTSDEFTELSYYILCHHERWDGAGYPKGLTEESIPLFSRIIAIADAFDAMTSERPYRKPLSMESAINEISRFAGTQFDPHLAKIFVTEHMKSKV